MKARVLILFVLGAVLATAAGNPKVGWMIYPYRLDMPEEQYRRLLNCEEAEYIGLQLMPHHTGDPQTQARVRELAATGKRIILQFWFGNWERHNFPNIALNPVIREEFFAEVSDPLIDWLGAENLYAIHLLEETGMQFAWDVDIPGRPDRDDDGIDVGGPYNNPPNWIMSRCISGPNVLTIRKFNDRFRQDTGMDMRFYPIWSDADMQRYRDWVQVTMEGGAHVQFARHIHAKYPGMRVYAFNSKCAMVPQRAVLDGHFMDPYTRIGGVFYVFRKFRSGIRPDAELIGMVFGNRGRQGEYLALPERRLPQQAAAYIGGCNVLSTFGDKEYEDDQWLSIVKDSVQPFIGLPVFKSRPHVLVLGGWVSCWSALQVRHWITGFADYDVSEQCWADDMNLNDYDLALSWCGNWHRNLPDWVRGGGVLLAGAPSTSQNFLLREGWIDSTGKTERVAIEYRPDAWMRENLRLAESYQVDVAAPGYVVKNADRVHQDQFLCVAEYGKGLAILLPAPQMPPREPGASKGYRQLLTDLGRGALQFQGKDAAAKRAFCERDKGNDYLMATSADGRITVYVLQIDNEEKSTTSFVVPGKDSVSGSRDVRFCAENPVVIIEKEQE